MSATQYVTNLGPGVYCVTGHSLSSRPVALHSEVMRAMTEAGHEHIGLAEIAKRELTVKGRPRLRVDFSDTIQYLELGGAP